MPMCVRYFLFHLGKEAIATCTGHCLPFASHISTIDIVPSLSMLLCACLRSPCAPAAEDTMMRQTVVLLLLCIAAAPAFAARVLLADIDAKGDTLTCMTSVIKVRQQGGYLDVHTLLERDLLSAVCMHALRPV